MGQALYRKYRSRSFDDVVGQEHIIKTLRNAIKTDKVSHAYLFTGPRGVGKTSIARILAHEINGLEYTDESMHLDIIEIDAASNRRIDEIRELRDKVHIAPTSAKYKVYIIDEVHMLTREAFNALLKTLEEPPAHCIFILATTEVHKLPETIISRTQHFSFKPIDNNLAAEHLKNLAKFEKINIDVDALQVLAEHGQGSLRDSVSLLDQLGGNGQRVDKARVEELMGLPPNLVVEQLVASLENGDTKTSLNLLDGLKESGVNYALLAKSINQQLRAKLLDGHTELWITGLLRNLTKVAASPNPQEELEIDILEAVTSNTTSTIIKPQIIESVETDDIEPSAEPVSKEINKDIVPEILSDDRPAEKPEILETGSKQELNNIELSLEAWQEVVSKTKSEAASIYTALRLATPKLDGNNLILSFQFPLHQKKLTQAKNIELLGKIIQDLTGAKPNIEAIVDKGLEKNKSNKPLQTEQINTPPSPDLQTINNIFGSTEVLES